jgi:biotin operon repressor
LPQDPLPEVTASRSRLRIADLVSTRPYGLKELAGATGISVQGVLKHLRKLRSLGLVQERSVRSPGLSVRKVYQAGEARVRDFSARDIILVKLSGGRPPESPVASLEELARDVLLERRRVRDAARRLGRSIDELVVDESRLAWAIESLGLDETERLVLQVIYTEETLAGAEQVLLREFGLKEGEGAIERAVAKGRGRVAGAPRRARRLNSR